MIEELTEDLITYIHLQKIMRQRSNTKLCFVQCRQCNAANQLPPAKTFNLTEGLHNIPVYIIEKIVYFARSPLTRIYEVSQPVNTIVVPARGG